MTRGETETPAGRGNAPRVLVLTVFFPPAYLAGGPIRSLEAMVRRSEAPEQYWVMTSNSDLESPGSLHVPTDRWVERWGSHVWYQRHGGWRSLLCALVAEARLRPDIIYLNSLWGLRYSTAYLMLRRLGLTRALVILAPRGQLSPAALAIKPGKKRVVLRVIKALGLTRGVLIQASSQREEHDIRRVFGSRADVVISGNDSLVEPIDADVLSRPGLALALVYVGRVSRIKGVGVLLEALAGLRPDLSVRFDLYGPVEQSCRDIAARAEDLSSRNLQVRVHGPVSHDQVPAVFAGADLLVLPTESENFGHVIGEALANGCPVVVPDTTPWTEAIRDGGGWLLPDRHPDSILSVVEEVAGLSPEERLQAKIRAVAAYRRWAAQRGRSALERRIGEVDQRRTSRRRG